MPSTDHSCKMDEYIDAKLCGAIKIKITEVFWHWVTLGHNPSQCQEVQYVYIDYDMHYCTKPSIILSRTSQLRDIHYALQSCASLIYYDILACTHAFQNLAQNDYTRQ